MMLGDAEHWRKRPGLTAFTTGLAGTVRGFFRDSNGKVLVAAGGMLYEINSAGTATTYTGSIADGRATWADDGSNVYHAAGEKISRIDTSAHTVTELGGNSPTGVTHVVYAKGYLLSNGLVSGGVVGDTNFSDDKTNAYQDSDSWEVFNNEAHPDGVSALEAGWDGEVYSFGAGSVEVSYNDGVTPWAVLQGATMQYGIAAPHSLRLIDNTFFWLSVADNARRIFRMTERTPTVISTPFDRLLQELSIVSDAYAWSQQIHGVPFYVISFPTARTTWACRVDDGTWSEFRFWNQSIAQYQQYLGSCALWVDPWAKMLIGSRTTGTIFEQTGTTDNGATIRMELTSGMTDHGTNKRKRERNLIHRVKRGYGEGEGTFGFRIRDDNGQWKNEKQLPLGALGTTNPYLKRPGGGRFRGRQYQYIHSDLQTDFIVMGLESDTELLE